jgi:acyl-CoA reductase-like NAD-dependent aldehyde dehydrogenase
MADKKISAAQKRYLADLAKLKPAHRAAILAAVRELLAAEERTRTISKRSE